LRFWERTFERSRLRGGEKQTRKIADSSIIIEKRYRRKMIEREKDGNEFVGWGEKKKRTETGVLKYRKRNYRQRKKKAPRRTITVKVSEGEVGMRSENGGKGERMKVRVEGSGWGREGERK